MTTPSFDEIWAQATRYAEPFPYQRRLATGDWPDILAVPTGLGKTAAVGISWIYRRMTACPETPRRLVYCLPMRVLAEQTFGEFRSWLSNLDLLGEPGEGRVSVSLLMGGEEGLREAAWALHPEEDVVLIGTQDMLLSRALMRGYGMSRYQWPMHFGLLHNDALWVFDEVQLMGPALATSAQLDAFRRGSPGVTPSRSLWLSATLRPEWLETVDFRAHVPHLRMLDVDDDDRMKAGDRLNARKRLHRAAVALDSRTASGKAEQYLAELARSIFQHHGSGEQTLVIVNRVDRAQELARRLASAQDAVPVLLVHARFRSAERERLNDGLRRDPGPSGRIIVATQAIEAGVDISSRTLFTELAPWSSMVQRFGRCNRRGEHADGADIFWIDITEDAGEAQPYGDTELVDARGTIEQLAVAAPSELPSVSSDRPPGPVLRWKDLIDLFDTDPDLSGFDIDIAPYIRDQEASQVRVFWRSFEDSPADDEPPPAREELCPVSMGQIGAYLKKTVKKRARRCWTWDPLLERWTEIRQTSRVRPGSTLLLRSADGGYDSVFGFDAMATKEVPVVDVDQATEYDTYSGDPSSRSRRFVALADHLQHVAREVDVLAEAVSASDREASALHAAALRHDVGKAHPAFQTAVLDYAGQAGLSRDTLWAKSASSGRLRYRIEDGETVHKRRHFRHELASMLAWLQHADGGEDVDLIGYLIAAHHGKVRMGLRALPSESLPPGDVLFARGIWDGDTLPSFRVNGTEIPETTLRLEIMRIGRGEMGPSWTERTRRLLAEFGPFRLAWLETLLRIADWTASAAEEEEGA